MQFAYSRDLEEDSSDLPDWLSDLPYRHRHVNNPIVDEVMRKGLCEVCRTRKATQHICFALHGNVSQMPVGGKTYNKVAMTVSLCDDCARKADEREKVRSNVCGFVFLGVGIMVATCTYSLHGSIWAGVISGVLFGGIAAGVVSSAMTDGHSKASICESVPRIKVLLDSGWHFGDKPGK